MQSIEINFPALVVSESSIDKINYRYLVGDKRDISEAYKNVLIIDSLGNCFETERVEKNGGLSLFYSIKLVGLIVRIKPILKKLVYRISLVMLQDKLISIRLWCLETVAITFLLFVFRNSWLKGVKEVTVLRRENSLTKII